MTLTTQPEKRNLKTVLLAGLATAIAATLLVPAAAEAAGCGRGGGYGYTKSTYRNAPKQTQSRVWDRGSKVATSRATAESKKAAKVVAAAPIKGATDAKPAQDAVAVAKTPGGKAIEIADAAKSEVAVVGSEASTKTASASIDCKLYVPGAGATISVPCGE